MIFLCRFPVPNITSDKLKFVERLEAGGFGHDQAWAVAEAFAGATSEAFVTKSFLKEEIAQIKTDVAILKWMQGFTLAAVMAILYMLITH